jgi:hypothetical protein
MDDVCKLRKHLCIVRLMAAVAAARRLCRWGIPTPSGTWQFENGWVDLMREMRNAKTSEGPLPLDVMRMIASGVPIDDPQREVADAELLLNRMQDGFIPPDPCPSENYRRGWEVACRALRESPEACLLEEALAEAKKVLEP